MALNTLESRVCEAIARRHAELLDDLRLHVGIPTGPGGTAGLDETRERLTARCKNLGASVEVIPGQPRPPWMRVGGPDERDAIAAPPTAVCRRLVAGRPAVLVAGHLDTVHDARSAFRELSIAPGGKTATGPGCADMKGGLVIAMAALEALDEVGAGVPWAFLMNSDEETGSFHSAAALASEGARPGYAAALALEPAMADGGLAVSRGGSGQFMIDAVGKAAHVGRDFTAGVSAVDALSRVIVAAGGLSRPAEGVCVNVGPLWCPTPANMVPPRARAWGNVRVPTPEAGAALAADLSRLSRDASGPLPHVAVNVTINRPPKPLTPGTRALADVARRTAEDLGQRLPFGSTAGVCDGNNLQAAGLACIDTVGVRGGGLHTPEEWIDLSSLVERCQLLAVLMLRITAKP